MTRSRLRDVVLVCVVLVSAGCLSAGTAVDTQTPTEDTGMNVQGTLDTDAEYIESNDTVRLPASGASGSEGTEIPFDRWGESAAADLAAERLRERLSQRLDAPLSGVAVTVQYTDAQASVAVRYQTIERPDGTTETTPSVEYDTLTAAVPETITATVTLDGESYTGTYDVSVQRQTLQQS